MADEIKQGEGPACACGKPDLYMESLKLKEKDHTGITGSSTPDKSDADNSSVDSSDNEDQKPGQIKE